MKRWMKTVCASICILAASATPVLAANEPETLPVPTETAGEVREMTVRGVLMYINLEGGFYSVGGWMLQGDPSQYEPLLDKVVIVTGTPSTGMSIQMVKSLTVTSIKVDPDQSVPGGSPISPILTPAPPEAGLKPIQPERPNPSWISVGGRQVAFDQGPVVSDSFLMVPVRFLVEAAGGEVEWDGVNHQVTVRMVDRVALFTVGSDVAETIVGGQNVFTLKMAKPAVLTGDRTLVPADALSSVLGFMERPGAEGQLYAMDLVAPAPALVQDMRSVLSGTIKQVEKGEVNRILVEGAAMSNGEPNLTWVTISPETKISVEENEQVKHADMSALTEGLMVEVETSGAIAMSYPALAGAASVLVKK